MIRVFALALSILAFAVNPVLAGLLINPFIVAPSVATISFVACTESTTDAQIQTFSSASVGTATADRATIIAIVAEDSASTFDVSSVTIGGDSATEIADEGGAGTANAAIYIMSNPSGTSEDIVTTHSEQVTANTICVWAAYGLNSTTAVGTATDTAGTLTLNLNVTAGGVAVGVAAAAGIGITSTWSGLTENADTAGTEHSWSVASDQTPTTTTPLSVSQDWSAGATRSGASASWR